MGIVSKSSFGKVVRTEKKNKEEEEEEDRAVFAHVTLVASKRIAGV